MSKVPALGSIIRYRYLWDYEAKQGREEAVKVRPAGVLLTVKTDKDRDLAIVLPITHTKPVDGEGIELSSQTKRRLKLDDRPQWIITTQWNYFEWPGFDVERWPNGMTTSGVLPEVVYKACVESFQWHHQQGKAFGLNRDDKER